MVSAIVATDLTGALRASGILIALWCLLSTSGLVAIRGTFAAGGIHSWDLASLRPGRIARSKWAASLYGQRGITVLLGVRITSALALFFASGAALAVPALAGIVASSVALVFSPVETDGADKMGLVSAMGAIVVAGGLILGDREVAFAGALFAGGQLTISYFASGVAKLGSRPWRDGSAIAGIMGTHGFGHPWAATVTERSALARIALCWTVIVGETLFPLALLAPLPVLAPTLAAFFLFHLATAIFMGLNTYPWAFVSAYPMVVVLSRTLRSLLGWE